MRIPKLLISSSFILLGFLMLSSCDKKNALLVNRRTATPERIEEIKEERGFMQLKNEREYLSSPLGEIVHIGNHFVYEVNGKRYDGAQTKNSCGIWAVRRKLRHMHHLGTYGIREDDWYRYSDKEMRQIIADISGDGHAETGKMLSTGKIVRLQMKFGVDENNATVRSTNRESISVYKEMLCVYNQEGEDRSSRSYSYYEGGNFHGFDYDRWVPAELGCCNYYKYPDLETQRLGKILNIDDYTYLNSNISSLPEPDVSPVVRTIKPTIDLALETLTHTINVINNPTLAKREDFLAAKARSAALTVATLNATAGATAVYNAARAVILYGEYIIAEVIGIDPSERSRGANAQAVAATSDIPDDVALITYAYILRNKVSAAADLAKSQADCARAAADQAKSQADCARAAADQADAATEAAIVNKIHCMNAARDAADAARAAAAAAKTARAKVRAAYNTVAEAVSAIIGRKIKDEDARAAASDAINNNDLTLTRDVATDNNFADGNVRDAIDNRDYDLATKCYTRDAVASAREAADSAREAAIDAYITANKRYAELISNHRNLEISYSAVAAGFVIKVGDLKILFNSFQRQNRRA